MTSSFDNPASAVEVVAKEEGADTGIVTVSATSDADFTTTSPNISRDTSFADLSNGGMKEAEIVAGAEEEHIPSVSHKKNFSLSPLFHSRSQNTIQHDQHHQQQQHQQQQQQQDRDSFETFASVPLSGYDEIRDAFPSTTAAARNDTFQSHRHRLIMSKIRVNNKSTCNSRNGVSSSKNEEKMAAKNRWLKKSQSVRKMKNKNGSSRRKSGRFKNRISANTATTTSQRLLGLSLGRSNVTSSSYSGDESHQSDEQEIHETLLGGHQNSRDHRYNYDKDGPKHTDGADDDSVDGFRIVHPHCPANDRNAISTTTGKNAFIVSTANSTTSSSVEEDDGRNKDEIDNVFFSNDNSFDRVELLESGSSEEVESSQSSSSSNNPSTVASCSHIKKETTGPAISSSYLQSIHPKDECTEFKDDRAKEDNDKGKEEKLHDVNTKQQSTIEEDETEGKYNITKPSLVVKTVDGVVTDSSKSLEKRPWSPPAIHSVKVEKTVCTFQDRLKFYQSKSKADIVDMPGRDVEEQHVDSNLFEKDKLIQVTSLPMDVHQSRNDAKMTMNQSFNSSSSQNLPMNKNTIEGHQSLTKKNTDETEVETRSFNFAALRARLQSTTNKQQSTNGKNPINNRRPNKCVENYESKREENHLVEQEQQIHAVQESSVAKANTDSPAMVARYPSLLATSNETGNLADLEIVEKEGNAAIRKAKECDKSDNIDNPGAVTCSINVRNESFSFSDRLKIFEVREEKKMGAHCLPSTPKPKRSDTTEGIRMTRRGTLLSVKLSKDNESYQKDIEVEMKPIASYNQGKCVSCDDNDKNNIQSQDNDDDDTDNDDSGISDRRQTLKSIRPIVQPNLNSTVRVEQREDPGGVCLGLATSSKSPTFDDPNKDQNSELSCVKQDVSVSDRTTIQNYNSRKRFFEMFAKQKGDNVFDRTFAGHLLSTEKVDKTPVGTSKSRGAHCEVLDQNSSNGETSVENSRESQDDDHPLYVTVQDDDVSSICYSASDFHPVVCKPAQNLEKYMSKFIKSTAVEEEVKHTTTSSAMDSSSSSDMKIKDGLNSFTNYSKKIAEETTEEKKYVKTSTITNYHSNDKVGVKVNRRWQNSKFEISVNNEGNGEICCVGLDPENHPGLKRVCQERKNTNSLKTLQQQNMAPSSQKIQGVTSINKTIENAETESLAKDGQQNIQKLNPSSIPKTQDATSTYRMSASILERCIVFQKPIRPNQSLSSLHNLHPMKEQHMDHDVSSSVNPDNSIQIKKLASPEVTKNKAAPRSFHQAQKISQRRSISLKDVLDSKRDSSDPIPSSQATVGGLSIQVNFSEGVLCDSNVRPSELLNRRKRVSPKQDLPSPLITRRGFSSMIRSPRSSKGSRAHLRCF